MAIDTTTSVDVQTLTPFKKFIMTIGALPTSYLESMTYAELVMWFCNYLQETVIPTVNNNAEAVEELQGLYEELRTYVNGYFDNLDVQEEINNKLDKMAEDGTLADLIGAYVQPLIDEQNEIITQYGATINLHTSQIANLVANASSTEENSELIDIRVANDGSTYQSAGDSVRNQVNNVNEYIKRDINTLNDGIYTDEINFDSFLFELGGINYNTGENTTNSSIIRTKGFITFNEFDNYFKIEYDGSALGDHIYMLVYELDGTYVNYHDIKNSYFGTLSPNKKYRLSIYSNATISNVNTFLADFTFKITSTIDRNNEIYDIDKQNIINPALMIENALPNTTTGYVVRQVSSTQYSSGTFKVKPNTTYYMDNPNFYQAFYDENGDLIDSVHYAANQNVLTSPFTTPVNAYYMSTTKYTNQVGVSAFISTKSSYTPFNDIVANVKSNVSGISIINNVSSLNNKTWNVLGDSISSTDYTTPCWWQKIQAVATNLTINNYGVSGTSIAVRDGRTDSFVERYSSMSNDCDFVTIMGGTNDYGVVKGAWDSTDNTTFCGALNNLMIGLIDKYAGKQIIFITPMAQANETYNPLTLETRFNALTNSSPLYNSDERYYIIKKKCEQYQLPCFDLFYKSGINGLDTNKIYYRTNDTLHPSAIGQQRLADVIGKYLNNRFI
jgi:lysophospholipase L1-like esterase